MNKDGRISAIALRMKSAKKVVVLTGAGISTESGIPDFRGKGGLYTEHGEDVLSLVSFEENPKNFYEVFQKKTKLILKAEPNEAHNILAKWEKSGYIHCVVTQNIDGLHQKAGSTQVIEYHGTLRTFTLPNSDPLIRVKLEDITTPEGLDYCLKDVEGVLKPDVVLFGEQVTEHTRARKEIKGADVVFIIGTSYLVAPFNTLLNGLSANALIVCINNSNIQVKTRAKKTWLCEITSSLKEIDNQLRESR